MGHISFINKFVKSAIFFVCRCIAGIRLKLKRVFPGNTKTVLLVGTSEVTVFDLLDADEVMTELGNKRSFMLVSRSTRTFARTKLLEQGVEIPQISLPQALCGAWDLIIFADHNNTRWFHPDIPKIKYGHGLTSGKSYGPGGSWAFGSSALNGRGKSLYDVMFVESRYYRDITLRENPALKNNLAVVGSLMADKLIALNLNRKATRQELGIQDEDKVLVIFSTWGPTSLIQRFGNPLLNQLPEVALKYRTYLIIHPLNDKEQFVGKDALFERLEVYKQEDIAVRIDPYQPWFPYLVAADVVLTDHTSLFLYYALLEKPFLFVPLVQEAIMEDSLIWRFFELSEPYIPEKSLMYQLESILENFPARSSNGLIKLVLDEQGKAKQRIYDEFARFW